MIFIWNTCPLTDFWIFKTFFKLNHCFAGQFVALPCLDIERCQILNVSHQRNNKLAVVREKRQKTTAKTVVLIATVRRQRIMHRVVWKCAEQSTWPVKDVKSFLDVIFKGTNRWMQYWMHKPKGQNPFGVRKTVVKGKDEFSKQKIIWNAKRT